MSIAERIDVADRQTAPVAGDRKGTRPDRIRRARRARRVDVRRDSASARSIRRRARCAVALHGRRHPLPTAPGTSGPEVAASNRLNRSEEESQATMDWTHLHWMCKAAARATCRGGRNRPGAYTIAGLAFQIASKRLALSPNRQDHVGMVGGQHALFVVLTNSALAGTATAIAEGAGRPLSAIRALGVSPAIDCCFVGGRLVGESAHGRAWWWRVRVRCRGQ